MEDNFEIIPIGWDMAQGAIIKVIGVGGGGNNAVNYMADLGISGVDFIICNTDGQVLQRSAIKNKIQLGCGLTRGRGAGCDPEIGKQAAIENIDKIKFALNDNTEMIFITAGMGGGTGTGATPVIAKVAKEMDILTVAIVTLPFIDEGFEPYQRAIAGINELRENVDTLLLISNNKLYEMYGDSPIRNGFKKADEILATAAKGIAEIITRHGFINVDFADVKKVMKNSGVALLGTGYGTGENRAIDAVNEALNSPLLNNNSIKGAKNILVNITSSETKELNFAELREIMAYIQHEAGRVENIKRGIVYDQSFDDEVSVTIIATGFEMNNIPEMNNISELYAYPMQVQNDIQEDLPDIDDDMIVKKSLTGLSLQEILDLEKEPAYKRKKIVIKIQQQSNQSITDKDVGEINSSGLAFHLNNAY
jgi:cell division protein FtsZ